MSSDKIVAILVAIVVGMVAIVVGIGGAAVALGPVIVKMRKPPVITHVQPKEAKSIAEPAKELKDSGISCILFQQMHVFRGEWEARMVNVCPNTTPRLYVRLAFYDEDQYRDGFDMFIIEPLAPKEKSLLKNKVPRPGAVSVKVFDSTGEPSKALQW